MESFIGDIKMEKEYLLLEEWLKNSEDGAIVIDGDEYSFNVIERFSNLDLLRFEIESNIKLPNQYKEFLLRFGAIELFSSDYSSGIEILSPYKVKEFSEDIFDNYGVNPYPNLFVSVNISSVGWFGGFDLTQETESNFSVFFPETPPELWIEEATFISFNSWLKKIISSNGEILF